MTIYMKPISVYLNDHDLHIIHLFSIYSLSEPFFCNLFFWTQLKFPLHFEILTDFLHIAVIASSEALKRYTFV